MTESKTADQRVQQRREDAAEKKEAAAEKTAANERQEAEKERQAEAAKKSAARAKAVESGKFTVVLRDEADSSVDAVSKLIAQQGAFVKSASKNKITVELPSAPEHPVEPPPPERDPIGSQRQRIVEHLLNSPHVEGVE